MPHARPRAAWALLIPFFALPALWPLFANGLPRAADTALHLARLELLHGHILAGTLWPRWLPEMTLGYGYLFFSYYAPATYYAAEALHLLGLSTVQAFQWLSAALIVGAGVTIFFFARDLFAEWGPPRVTLAAALVAAVAATYNPYLLTNVYLRGAFGEAGAQVLLPLILLAVRRVFRSAAPERAALLLAFALAALALTHTLSLLFAPAVILGYTLVLWWAAGRDRARLAWAGAGLGLALALSAAFWLPLLLQRDLVTDAGTELARSVRLPSGVWTWGNFLDAGLRYTHTFARPVRLGLLQLALSVAGFLLVLTRARRRAGRLLPGRVQALPPTQRASAPFPEGGDTEHWSLNTSHLVAEWLYLGAVALAGGLLIGAWALPLWQNSPLVVAQFAWRLLSVVTLPLALFAGGVVFAGGGWPRRTALLGAALIALIVVAQRPRLDWLDVFAPAAVPGRASIAQLEVAKGVAAGGAQNSNIQEFRPRGAPAELVLAEQPPAPAMPPTVTVVAGSGFVTDLRVAAPVAAALRLADFYHPNWRVTLDDGLDPLPTYPSTSLSLLTVDVPPGGHALRVRWVPSAVEWAGAAITLAALAGLGAWAALRRRNWPLALLAGALFAGCAAAYYTPAPPTVAAPAAEVAAHGLRLAGLRVEAGDPAQALVRAWWHVGEPPPAGLRVRWVVRDAVSGALVGDSLGAPWFNTADTQQWPLGTLVDDAYALPLPAGLPAGDFDLALELLAPGDEPSAAPDALPAVARFTVTRALPLGRMPEYPFTAEVGDSIRLVGYDLDGARVRENVSAPWVRAGRRVRLTLYWQTDRVLPADYGTFAHLLDAEGAGLVKEDQTPGPEFHATAAWLPGRTYTDRFLLHIPGDALGGLYSPWVGMADAAGQRLPVSVSGSPPADEARLPPIKVVQRTAPVPHYPLGIRFGDLARLTGYDLSAPGSLRAGDAFTVTLHLDSVSSTGGPFIRFLQLLDAQGNIVAQHDGPPARINPTESWLPGERILDAVHLAVDPAALPGMYTLVTGFYAFGAPDERVPAMNADGIPLEDNVVELGKVRIAP